MSQQHRISIPAHHNIYTGTSDRELRIDFCTPDAGVNPDTGLVIFVPGFGGNIDSKVYAKMRNVFADAYNLVTIQCDYFGSSYMQAAQHFTFKNPQAVASLLTPEEIGEVQKDSSRLLDILSGKHAEIPVTADIKESMEEFNDMGYMQAIDVITAVEAVKTILLENHLDFNAGRVIGYGHSHGAYLLHLVNRLVPDLLSFIIDNSAWIRPVYLTQNRMLYQRVGTSTFAVEFDYLAKKVIRDPNKLSLNSLYKNFANRAQILTFQGDHDLLVNFHEKKAIIDRLNHSEFILVTRQDVDNKKYKSNSHGLDADFLELFAYALEFEQQRQLPSHAARSRAGFTAHLEPFEITVDYSRGLPVFHFL